MVFQSGLFYASKTGWSMKKCQRKIQTSGLL
nr:MAG TPA: hypothetical protein [Caudoviricetes sp.]